MVRVDSSRTRVETAQVARAVLDQISNDLKAARFQSPQSSRGRSSGGTGGSGSSGGSDSGTGGEASGAAGASGTGGATGSGSGGGSATGESASSNSSSSDPPGVNGTEVELRIDRIATSHWDRALLSEQSLLATDANLTRASVRYFLDDGRRMISQQVAELGVEPEPTAGVGGLYREVAPTAVLIDEQVSVASSNTTGSGQRLSESSKLKLLAPEVVELTFAYFDGETLEDQWDMAEQGKLPLGVEVRLKIVEMSYEEALQKNADQRASSSSVSKDDVVEYRRFVQLPTLRRQSRRMQHLLVPQQNQPSGGGQEGGNGGNGGAQNGGQNGAQHGDQNAGGGSGDN
jgi:hypothetical protein